jgi:hypothetical protein
VLKEAAYRTVANRHGTLDLQKLHTIFGHEIWLPYAWNVSLYAAQRIMEKRSKAPTYYLADGTVIPDIW